LEIHDGDDDPKEAVDYEVGYGRPPKHTRFQPGRSGNPSGKRKRNKPLGDAIAAALGEFLTVTEGGRRKRMRADVIIAKKLRTAALNGDTSAAKFLFDRAKGSAEAGGYDLTKLSDEELDTLEKILEKAMPTPALGD
jgi:hypothetical protein